MLHLGLGRGALKKTNLIQKLCLPRCVLGCGGGVETDKFDSKLCLCCFILGWGVGALKETNLMESFACDASSWDGAGGGVEKKQI